jgi:hypothetical protein
MEINVLDLVVNPQVGALSASLVAVIAAIGQVPIGKKKIRDLALWRRALPVAVLVFGVAGALLIPGLVDGSVVEKIVIGLVAAMMASHGRKVVKRLLVDEIGETK